MNNIEVLISRPEKRFGYAVHVVRTDVSGKKQCLRFDGWNEIWEDIVPQGTTEPTFYSDDGILGAIVKAYTDLVPTPRPDPDVPRVLKEALDDTRLVRDKTFDLMQQVLDKIQ